MRFSQGASMMRGRFSEAVYLRTSSYRGHFGTHVVETHEPIENSPDTLRAYDENPMVDPHIVDEMFCQSVKYLKHLEDKGLAQLSSVRARLKDERMSFERRKELLNEERKLCRAILTEYRPESAYDYVVRKSKISVYLGRKRRLISACRGH
jgi:hypothetical protein